ncbi:hypothetical protein LOZ80_25200 [Paenibacillus sp. HWE-109]|uniref:hypothetical protein n=1 Tax=Paenibacillus sp. HWE-109 TaxID=1306526 RepID=UPI001EDE1DB2|nr:hypothetical protein [Paenibacillus sp. HWE-109]UKS24887.1 hypothetical protein LOZ80_25200 [Paenibacillus sp. HWE-109]
MRQGTTKTTGKQIESAEAASYPKEELIAQSQALFACQPEVLIGALHGSIETDFTLEAANQCIQNFLQRKVLA